MKKRGQRRSEALQMREASRKVEALQKEVLQHYLFERNSKPDCFHEKNLSYSADTVSRQYESSDGELGLIHGLN